MAIHEEDGVCVISSHRQWRPGCYKDKRTANYAFRFADEDLADLQESINPGGIITFQMLQVKAQKNKQMSSVS